MSQLPMVMSFPSGRQFLRYVESVLYVTAALLITQQFERDIEPATSSLFFAAVMISAFRGGTGPALAATILAALATDYYISPPIYTLKLTGADLLRSSAFLFAALLISLLGGRQKRLMGELQAENAERAREKEVRRELLHRLVNAQEEERRRISRELHDQMGQYTTALSWALTSLEKSPDVKPPAGGDIEHLRELTRQLDCVVDRLALELRPTILDDLGLHSALVQYIDDWSKRYSMPTTYQITGIDQQRLPPNIETPIYRVVQEALTNVLKHARAKHVRLTLERRNNHVFTIVEDNGCGFDSDALEREPDVHTRLGLLGMRERVAMAGGILNIESAPGKGTNVLVRIPITTG